MLIQNVSTLNKLSNWFPLHVQFMSKSQKHPPKKKSGNVNFSSVYLDGMMIWVWFRILDLKSSFHPNKYN